MTENMDNEVLRPQVQDQDTKGQGEERSIPPVGSSGVNKDKLFWPLMIGLLVVAGIVVVGFNSFGEDDTSKIVKQKAEPYKREKITKLEIPKDIPKAIQNTEPAPPAAEPKATVVQQPKEEPVIDHAAAERKRQEAERRRREWEKRMGAPLVIYDNLGKHGTAAAVGTRQSEQVDRLNALQEQLLEKVNGQIDVNAQKGRAPGLTAMTMPENSSRPAGYVTASYMDPEKQRYTVTEGTMFSAVLETAIQSNLAGKLRAIADEDVYSMDGRTKLVEKGTTYIGEYQSGLKQGQVRIFAIWNRMITPLGVNVELQSPGTDQLGRAGLSGWVDTHFWERFGSSVMLSIIGAYTAREASSETDNSQIIAQSVSDNFNKSSEIALENSINIPPTLHKNQGDLIKIFVARDINFKNAYLLSQNQRREQELAAQ